MFGGKRNEREPDSSPWRRCRRVGRIECARGEVGIQGELTAAENLRLASRVFTRRGHAGQGEDEALARVGLRAQADRPARHLSQGQKRRLALARLLVLRRPLWVLDEPFTALDVASVASLSSLIGEHMAAGGLALVVSHQAFDLPGIRDFELARYCRTRR